ncbi:DNA repair exonuclease [Candidatus Azambacteria bacterium]|nr:DNA repair exonuclease [Candidatus Azambacteria bacterium]MBI3685472.1 DNA repair exonuclease [Candidatus Azambacteria bacterium]
MVRIIHTSDVHIGAKFLGFGKKAQVQRQALLDVFAKTVDLAISSKAHMLVVAGDLFDSNFPSYQSVHFVKQQFKRLNEAKIYAVLSAGTHDCLSKGSIYKREDFAFDLPYVYVFDGETTAKEFPDIDLTVYAKANVSNKSTESPVAFLASASTSATTKYKIAMAHGSVQIEGKAAKDDLPITLGEIADSGMDYIALGHWHGAQEFSSGKTIAWYSGSPEITYQEGKGGLGQGYVLQVDIAGTVAVKPIKTTAKEVREIRLDMQTLATAENITRELERIADPNLIVVAEISGIVAPETALLIDAEKIEEECRDKFFSIKVNNNIALETGEDNALAYPEELVIGQFVRVMRAKLEEAKSEEEKRILQDALQIGVAELEGKNVLGD